MLALTLAAGCKKSDQLGGTDTRSEKEPVTLGVAAVTTAGEASGPVVMKTIGASGGTISSHDGNLTLKFPAGALVGDQAITVQAITNKAPNGMTNAAWRLLPHGLEFAKPVTLEFKYKKDNQDLFAPELLMLATQLSNGKWQVLENVKIQPATNTVSVELEHFSDYAFFLEYILLDDKTGSAYEQIRLNTTLSVALNLYRVTPVKEKLDEDDIFIPLPHKISSNEGNIIEWAVNGVVNPPQEADYGYYTEADRAHAVYRAPRKAPNRKIIDLNAKLNFPKRKGLFYLVRQVVPVDNNSFTFKGTVHSNVLPSALLIGDYMQASLTDTSVHPKMPHLGISIEGYNGPGTYNFSEKTIVTATDKDGKSWQHYTYAGTQLVYGPGNIVITEEGPGGNFLRCKINGTLHYVGNPPGTGDLKGTIEVSFWKVE